MRHGLEVVPIPGLPEIGSGDSLGELIAGALTGAGLEPRDDDVVAVAQKAVSKAEGRVRSLDEVAPGPKARRLAERLGKDPRLVELILSESRSRRRRQTEIDRVTEFVGGEAELHAHRSLADRALHRVIATQHRSREAFGPRP